MPISSFRVLPALAAYNQKPNVTRQTFGSRGFLNPPSLAQLVERHPQAIARLSS